MYSVDTDEVGGIRIMVFADWPTAKPFLERILMISHSSTIKFIDMAACKYCGEKAGFLSNKHYFCELKYKQGKQRVAQMVEYILRNGGEFSSLKKRIKEIAISSAVRLQELDAIYIKTFNKAVNSLIEEGHFTEAIEDRIAEFQQAFQLSQEMLDQDGTLKRVAKLSIIRDLDKGLIPEPRMVVESYLPFHLQNTEQLIWIFNDVECYKQNPNLQADTSLRMLGKNEKRHYYRKVDEKSETVKMVQMQHMGDGTCALTNEHVYFTSGNKKYKLKINNIASTEAFKDQISLFREGFDSDAQLFKNIDGVFMYNAINRLIS